jgi:cell division protein FtsB
MIPEAAASAATANKVTAGGFGVIGMGWLSSTTTIALIGLAITLLGGVWSFLSWLQDRRNKKSKRAEEARLYALAEEEHALRMLVLAAELRNAEKARSAL